ncbi:MAG: FprA family A-type flavoprotein [Candidatus Bathyarchaeota archaeon]|nr:MAG: FprA family A-type flavoprotein [Candidatus Bathyarchaeota archaeon]
MAFKTVEISPNVFWVGIEDWNRRFFDAFIPLPNGTSYNSYLIVGKEKTALIDTVNPGFEKILLKKISQIVPPGKIDYIIMNHAEPDHAGGILEVMKVAPNAKVVATKLGVDMTKIYFDVPSERRISVKDGDTLELGQKTLKFIEAPWLHWPETMFTFNMEDSVLFTCDFLGSHITSDKLFADEVGGLLMPEAKRYYAEIMMPFSASAQKALDKVNLLNPKIIAPSHGPVHRNPQSIIEAYEKWTRGPLEKKVIVVYVSMWGSTQTLERIITETISTEGVETVPYNLTVADISHVLRDLVDASAVVIGTPTVLGGAHPLALYATELIASFGVRGKIAAIFGSFGWGGGATRRVKLRLEKGGFEVVYTLDVRGPPKPAHIEKAVSLGKAVAKRVKEAT